MTARAPDLHVEAYASSDVGRVRKGNEDRFLTGRTVFAVADGMGGHVAGEVASETALTPLAKLDGRDFISPEDADQALADALRTANDDVAEKAEADPQYRGMGTTLTAVLVRDGRLHLAHVGDSRAYLLRDGEQISQLTTDHTLVERLIQEGRLSRDEAGSHPQRNVITRAIGHDREVTVDQLPPLQLQPGDQVLLCSDGLTGPVDDAEVANVLQSTGDGDEAVRRLVRAANEAGGPDNITVVLLRVESSHAMTGGTPADGQTGPPHGVPDAGHIRHIRTRQESDTSDWAETMGRIGAPQGVHRQSGDDREATGGGRRVVAGALAVLVLLAVVVGGGWLLLSRAYFVGAYEDQVAIYNGLPQQVAGLDLAWIVDNGVTDLELAAFPTFRQEEIRAGLTAGTLSEARTIVDQLQTEAARDEAAETQPVAEPTPSPTPSPSPEPGATRQPARQRNRPATSP